MLSPHLPPRIICALSLLLPALPAQDVRLLEQVFSRMGANPDASPSHFVAFGSHVYSSTRVGLYRYDTSGTEARGLYVDSVRELVPAGRNLFFIGSNNALFSTDGTSIGTTFLDPLGTIVGPSNLTPLANKAVFVATGSTSGRELWISDGSVAGTTILSDIRKGTGSSSPRELTVHGSAVYFVADDGVSGEELWRTDGTATGTVRILDLRAGAASAGIQHLRSDGSKLWFYADKTGGRFELWRSDGTASGTVAVVAATPHPSLHTFPGGVLSLQARSNRAELWGSDGTRTGTALIKDLGPASSRTTDIQPVVAGGYSYFAVPDASGNGQLWRSDGTPAGTIALTMISRLPQGAQLAALGTRVFFPGGLGTARGTELWVTDGTAAGTRELKDIHPSSSSRPSALTTIGNRIFMSADDGRFGAEPWSTDGTANGTRMVANVANWQRQSGEDVNMLVADDTGWWLREQGATAELWKTDGTAAGTSSVRILGYPPTRFLMAGLGRVFFSAPPSASSQVAHDLWVSDGTPAGTKLLKAKVGYCQHMADLGDIAVFGGGIYGHELWVTDGTAAGTKPLNAQVWPLRVRESRLVRIGDKAWFLGGSGRLGVTDGTVAGTRTVTASASYTMTSEPIRFGHRVAFLARHNKLVLTDGTVAGTSEVVIRTSATLQAPNTFLANSKGVFILHADLNRFGSELWFSDFTTAGTRRLAVENNFLMTGGRIFRDRFFFAWRAKASGAEPWVSDGTPGGTAILRDIEPGPGHSFGGFGTGVGSRYLYFTAAKDLRGSLWRTDGTRAGTQPLSQSPRAPQHPLAHIGGRLFHMGVDQRLGFQPHVVDLFANHKVIGHGCASTSRVPSLTATDPVLGGHLRLTLASPHANQTAVALLGLPTSGAGYARLPGGCTILPDLSQPFVPIMFRTNASGGGQLSLSIPPIPILNRARLYAQAAVGRTATAPLGTDLTPGVSLTLGR